MIKHNKPTISAKDVQAVGQALRKEHVALGVEVQRFERAFTRYYGNKGASCAVNSGTTALYLALWALNIKKGDEVIIPTYVCSALLNAINMLGAKPVVVDVDEDDFNISFEAVKKAKTRKTKAIVLVHMYGVPADINKFKSLKVPLIEDCCQAIGAKYKGRKVGTIGDIAIFSFYATKLLTTGHGGMVYSKNKSLIKKIADYVDFDSRPTYYPRFNFKMTDFQAALGIVQLKQLNKFLAKRRAIVQKYQKVLKKYSVSTQEQVKGASRIYYRFVLRTNKARRIINELARKRVSAVVPTRNWELLHRYLKKSPRNFKNAEKIASTSVSLPIFPAMTAKDITKAVKALDSTLKKVKA